VEQEHESIYGHLLDTPSHLWACVIITKGGTSGQLNLIPLLLAWIAGSLTWGFGFVMAERTKYPAESRIQVTA
jgi:hypothetical protein